MLGEKTKKNLEEAFAGESMARNKYDYFASVANLKAAFEGELFENSNMYPRMAAEAREEGHEDIAVLFDHVGEVEKHHETRYRKLSINLETGEVFKKVGPKRWKCLNCGHIYEGEEAPLVCPTCSHPQAFFELLAENY